MIVSSVLVISLLAISVFAIPIFAIPIFAIPIPPELVYKIGLDAEPQSFPVP